MHLILVTGTAGSGKSLLTASLVAWYKEKGRDALTVNLDPGVLNLPYEPDIDVRTMIDYQGLMNTYSLGPNGALILASDLIAGKLAEIQDEVDSSNPEFVIADTPGQVELFAFRESGPYLAKELKADSKTVLFLMDSLIASSPTSFLSLLLLSTAVQLRMGLPHMQILSKTDLAKSPHEIAKWATDPSLFEERLSGVKSGDTYVYYSELFKALRRAQVSPDLYPVSAYTRDGFIALVGELSRIAETGEELTD